MKKHRKFLANDPSVTLQLLSSLGYNPSNLLTPPKKKKKHVNVAKKNIGGSSKVISDK